MAGGIVFAYAAGKYEISLSDCDSLQKNNAVGHTLTMTGTSDSCVI
jgi:hypothetical protein